MLIEDKAVVVFQGDSVSDCGRSRDDDENLGGGYVATVAAWFSASHPEKRVRFLNRGIGGDRVKDLRALADRSSQFEADVGFNPHWYQRYLASVR